MSWPVTTQYTKTMTIARMAIPICSGTGRVRIHDLTPHMMPDLLTIQQSIASRCPRSTRADLRRYRCARPDLPRGRRPARPTLPSGGRTPKRWPRQMGASQMNGRSWTLRSLCVKTMPLRTTTSTPIVQPTAPRMWRSGGSHDRKARIMSSKITTEIANPAAASKVELSLFGEVIRSKRDLRRRVGGAPTITRPNFPSGAPLVTSSSVPLTNFILPPGAWQQPRFTRSCPPRGRTAAISRQFTLADDDRVQP